MAVSRPLLFALVGTIVLFAAVTGMRVMGGGEDAAPSTSAASTAAPATSAEGPPASSTGSSSAVSGTEATAGKSRERRPSEAARRPRGAGSNDPVSVRVTRALAERRVVVLFFGARGSDDKVTRESARAVRGSDVAVFTDSVYKLDDYVRAVGPLPLTQVPATVIIDRDRQARVVQGFADAGTLRQLVADVR